MYQQPKCPYLHFSLALEFNFRVLFSLWVSLTYLFIVKRRCNFVFYTFLFYRKFIKWKRKTDEVFNKFKQNACFRCSPKYKGKFQTWLRKWMQMFSHGLEMFFCIRVTNPYSEWRGNVIRVFDSVSCRQTLVLNGSNCSIKLNLCW